MNFLEIVQATGQRSGTIDSRVVLTTGTGANERIRLIAGLVNSVWLEIQDQYRGWRFLIANLPSIFRFETGIARYPALASSFALNAPWSEWIAGEDPESTPMTVWEADGDRSDEKALYWIDYTAFNPTYERGETRTRTGRPQAVSVNEHDELVIWPVPDRDYSVAGTYRRAPQRLEDDDDVPIVAEEFHELLVWAATVLLHEVDEADPALIVTARQQANMRLAALRRRYLTRGARLSYRPIGGGSPGIRSLSPLSPPS